MAIAVVRKPAYDAETGKLAGAAGGCYSRRHAMRRGHVSRHIYYVMEGLVDATPAGLCRGRALGHPRRSSAS